MGQHPPWGQRGFQLRGQVQVQARSDAALHGASAPPPVSLHLGWLTTLGNSFFKTLSTSVTTCKVEGFQILVSLSLFMVFPRFAYVLLIGFSQNNGLN